MNYLYLLITKIPWYKAKYIFRSVRFHEALLLFSAGILVLPLFVSFTTQLPEWIGWVLAYWILGGLPMVSGRTFWDIPIRFLRFHRAPYWVKGLVYWVLGVVALTIPVAAASLLGRSHIIIASLFLIICIPVYEIQSRVRIKYHLFAGKYPQWSDIKQPKLIWRNIQNAYSKLLSDERHTPHSRGMVIPFKKEVVIAAISIILVLIYYVHWGSYTEFISFNSDNPQNVHLANLIRFESVWHFFAFYLTPQSTTIQYSTVMSSPLVLALEFFDFRKIMIMMYPFEVIVTLLVAIQRGFLFKEFKITPYFAWPLAAFSCMLTFGGIYVPGTFFNQQVLVLMLPTLFYCVIKRKFISASAVCAILLLFHMTLSLFVWMYSGAFFVFGGLNKSLAQHWKFIPWIAFFLLTILLLLATYFTIDLNLTTIDFSFSVIKSAQFTSTVDMYSNLAIVQIFAHGIGPFFSVILLLSGPLWLFNREDHYDWAFGLVIFQLAVMLVPVPVAHRTFAFVAIPLVMVIYLVVKSMMDHNKAFTSFLLLLSVSTFFGWRFTARAQDQDLIGNYGNRPFITRNYLTLMNQVADDIAKASGGETETVQVVAEYFTKHYIEVAMYKKDDKGVYEEDPETRAVAHRILRGTFSEVCSYYQRDVAIVLTERSEKWIRVPESLAEKFSFSIWFSEPPTEVELYAMSVFPYPKEGIVTVDAMYDEGRLLYISCIDFLNENNIPVRTGPDNSLKFNSGESLQIQQINPTTS